MNSKLKIIFISNIPTPYQLDFQQALNKQRSIKMHNIYFWNTESNRYWNIKINSQYTTVLTDSFPLFKFIQLIRVIRKLNPQIIMLGGYQLPFIIPLIILLKILNKKIIFWLEVPFPANFFVKAVKNCLIALKLKGADLVLAIGQSSKEYYKRFCRQTIVFPYNSNLEPFFKISRQRSVSQKNKKIRFLYCGQYIPRKNILNLLKAFHEIVSNDIKLNLAGSGSLSNRVKDYERLDSRINNLGFIDSKNLPQVYAQNDVLVIPSLHDGWALVVPEGMASAMPVISNRAVGAAEALIQNHQNGILCGHSVREIKKALEYYIKNSQRVYQEGVNARESLIKSSLDSSKAARLFLKTLTQYFDGYQKFKI